VDHPVVQDFHAYKTGLTRGRLLCYHPYWQRTGGAFRIMRVTQTDFRTIQVEKLSKSFRLRYSLYQNGEMRYPESITCRGDTVVAYFLTSTIRDFIAETAHGFCIERHWNIVPEGIFGLSFCLEIPIDSEAAYMFPGVTIGQPVPQSVERCTGEQTCYANGLFLIGKQESVLIFSDPAASPGETGSIEVQRLQDDGETYVARTELRIPAAGEPSQKEARKRRQETLFFRSDGQFDYNLRLNVVTAPADQIHRRAISAVLDRNKTALHAHLRPSSPSIHDTLRSQIEDCQKTFLVDRGPICGLLETKGANRLSSLAGCTLALLQLKIVPEDRDGVELALRLADFTLKGQHPRGLFYPYYWRDRQSWLPPDSPIAVPLQASATIALMLAQLAALLESKGLPASVYLHAASHMADSLLNQDLEDPADLLYPDSLLSAGAEVGAASGSPSLVELFLKLHEITGKDRYRKAVEKLKSAFFARKPRPLLLLGLENGASELDTILAEARAAVSLDASGHPVKGLARYFDALLSRIYLNRPDSRSEFNPVGGISPAPGNPILLFRGFELSHTLMALDARMRTSSRLEQLHLLILQILGFTLQKPPGTSYFDSNQKQNGRFGSLNSNIWVRELYYMGRLHDEFPQAVSG
jgi:hypothetical protein